MASNPLFDVLNSRKGANALIGLGTGLLSGKTFSEGLALGGQQFIKGNELDNQYAFEEAEAAKEAKQYAQTADFLQSQGFTDLVPLVEAGQGGAALSEAFKRMQPGYGAVEAPKPIEVGGGSA